MRRRCAVDPPPKKKKSVPGIDCLLDLITVSQTSVQSAQMSRAPSFRGLVCSAVGSLLVLSYTLSTHRENVIQIGQQF